MPFNNLISRTDAAVLIPEDVVGSIIQQLPEKSAALALFRTIRMSRAQQRMPVLSALPTAYFVNGDTGLKQTTELAWANKFLNVEEIAAIVVVPDSVIADAERGIFDSVQPRLVEAIGRTLDAAIFFGTNKPASWPGAIVPTAVAAGNVVARGTATAANGGIGGDLSALFATVENDGYDVNGVVANRSFRSFVRNYRDTQGRSNDDPYFGLDAKYVLRGLWPTGVSAAEVIAGDFTEGILGIREDISFQVSNQAVIQDAAGVIQFNAFQQDLTALRVTFRVAWTTANTLVPADDNAAIYPFGVLRSPAV